MIKVVKKHRKSQLKCYQMVLYTIKKLLPIKYLLQILQSTGINNYISKLSRKTTVKELDKMGKKDKIGLKKGSSTVAYRGPCLSYENIYK